MQSPLLIAQFEALGATAIPIAFSELYGALQQGVVECQENPLLTISVMKFYEVQDYLALSNHGYLGTAFIFSKVWFDQLDEDTQKVLIDAAKESGIYERKVAAELNDEILEQIKGAGTTEIIDLTDAQKQAFADAMKPVHAQFADVIGADLLDQTYAKVKELTGE
jgi:C4-dicarboxylate-binding protein DctP